MPGIFIKYDLEAVSVDISEERSTTFVHFLVRLCGIVGGEGSVNIDDNWLTSASNSSGVFVTAGIVLSALTNIVAMVSQNKVQ